MSSKVPRPTVEVGWASIFVYVDFFSRPSSTENIYIAQASLRGYWNWICVGTGRDWQLFQNKKVQFCCRGRFLSSARMELFFLTIWHLGPEPKWNFASKWPLKFDFGAGDIPFWREIRFWRRIQLLCWRKRNSILAEEKKMFCSKIGWTLFWKKLDFLYTVYIYVRAQ